MDSIDRVVKDINALEERMEDLIFEKTDDAFLIEKLQDALIWCSGSADFGVGGQARKGWVKLCEPLLMNINNSKPII